MEQWVSVLFHDLLFDVGRLCGEAVQEGGDWWVGCLILRDNLGVSPEITAVACQRGTLVSHGPHTPSHGPPRFPMGHHGLRWESVPSRGPVRPTSRSKSTLAKHPLPWETASPHCPAHSNILCSCKLQLCNYINYFNKGCKTTGILSGLLNNKGFA